MEKRSARDLFPGALELMVLRTVALEPLHGYAIASRIQQRSEAVLQVEEGTLYPALQRLQRDGMVKGRWETSLSGRRVRTYSITRKGVRRLEHEQKSFDAMVDGIRRVLAPAPETGA